MSPDERLADLEARVHELTALLATARKESGLDDFEEQQRRLAEQAARVADAARYFIMAP